MLCLDTIKWCCVLLCLPVCVHIVHSVECGPYTIESIVDGDTIVVNKDGIHTTITLDFVEPHKLTQTSSSKQTLTQQKSAEAARTCLTEILTRSDGKLWKVTLWNSAKIFPTDPHGNIRAVPIIHLPKDISKPFEPAQSAWAIDGLIANGHSVYWRRQGDAPPAQHKRLLGLQEIAKSIKAARWTTETHIMERQSSLTTQHKPKIQSP